MKNKFQKLIYSAFMAIAIFGSCSTEESDFRQDVSTAAYRLGTFNSSATATQTVGVFYRVDDEDTVKISVEEIDENRCPSDVVCFHGGYVRVSFAIRGLNLPVDLYITSLNGFGTNPEQHYFTLGDRNYILVLESVTPYPTTTNSDQEKSVQFVLEQY